MAEESFILVSLKEDQAKKLAQVLSNDTSRQILDFLSKKAHATETEIAKELKVPLSTVHYNLSLLTAAKLVNNDEFTYSEKGKEIIHYSISNKYVIIAPPNSEVGMAERLKKLLPVFGIISATSVAIHFAYNNLYRLYQPLAMEAAPAMMKSVAITEEAVGGAVADRTADAAAEFANIAPPEPAFNLLTYIADQIQMIPVSAWFFIGALFSALIIYLVVFNKKKKK
ncbi:MAG: helix-turn-helix domain-containing protein [archaeon]